MPTESIEIVRDGRRIGTAAADALRRDFCSHHVSDRATQSATGGYHARYRAGHHHIKLTYWFSTSNA